MRVSAGATGAIPVIDVIVRTAVAGQAYDQMLGEGNAAGDAILQEVIDRLVAQAETYEQAVVALDLEIGAFEGSDSLDEPGGGVPASGGRRCADPGFRPPPRCRRSPSRSTGRLLDARWTVPRQCLPVPAGAGASRRPFAPSPSVLPSSACLPRP